MRMGSSGWRSSCKKKGSEEKDGGRGGGWVGGKGGGRSERSGIRCVCARRVVALRS